MTSGLALVFLVILTVANYFLGSRRVLYPPLIYSAVWSFDLVIFALSPLELNKVHAVTWWVITIGALVFSIGGWLARFVPRAVIATRISELSRPTVSRLGRFILLSICILAVPIMLRDVAQRGSGGVGSTLATARAAYTQMSNEGVAPNPVVSKLPAFSVYVAIICLIEDADIFFWIAFLISVTCCVLTTGRSWVLMLLAAVAATLILKNKKDNLRGLFKFALVPFLLFVVLFIGLIFTGKDVSSFRGDNEAILENFALAYVVAPLPALDYVLTHPSDYAHAPNHTFSFFSEVANRLGSQIKLPPGLDAATPVPLPTNVYTVYKFFFTDFGFLGMFVTVFLIGFAQTVIYRRAVAGGRISLFLCALLTFPAVFSIFDDQYAGSILILLKGASLAIIYFCFLSRIRPGISVPRFKIGLWSPRRRAA